MATIVQPPLFSWHQVEARSDLDRLEFALKCMPDEPLMQELEAQRGHGRDDYPVRSMWNAVVAGVVFQHISIESLRRELGRNPALLQCCGFNVLPLSHKPRLQLVASNTDTQKCTYPVVASDENCLTLQACIGLFGIDIDMPSANVGCAPPQDKRAPKIIACERKKTQPKPDNTADGYRGVPSAFAFSRFLGKLIAVNEKRDFIKEMVGDLRLGLLEELPGFGQHGGYDGKAISSHSTGQANRETGKTSDPDADWGHHETHGVDTKTGNMWSKVKTWFGYSVHLIADTQYEIPLAFEVTPASHGESPVLRRMIADLYRETPTLAERCADFSADRGLDAAETKSLLWDEYKIRPLIDTRLMWRAEKSEPGYDATKPITRPLFPDRADTIVFTERGTVHCISPVSGEMRDMAFQGFEADRDTLKYRCPAAACGSICAGRDACHKAGGVQAGDYGRIVRIDLHTHDRRIFTPTPHGSPSWQRGYNRRSALERINNRIDNSFCFENHFIRGLAKMKVRVGLALCVMMAMALGHVKAGRPEQMRSLVQPICASG